MFDPPHSEIAGLFDVVGSAYSLWYFGDERFLVETQQAASALDEGLIPWKKVFVQRWGGPRQANPDGGGSCRVEVWRTELVNDRNSEKEIAWIIDKFRKSVEHLEWYLGPSEKKSPPGSPYEYSARWGEATGTQIYIYVQDEDVDLPISLWVDILGGRAIPDPVGGDETAFDFHKAVGYAALAKGDFAAADEHYRFAFDAGKKRRKEVVEDLTKYVETKLPNNAQAAAMLERFKCGKW